MQSNEFVTYIRAASQPDELVRIHAAIRGKYPKHKFRVLGFQFKEIKRGHFSAVNKNYMIYEMSSEIRKENKDRWQGDDDNWRHMFLELNEVMSINCDVEDS